MTRAGSAAAPAKTAGSTTRPRSRRTDVHAVIEALGVGPVEMSLRESAGAEKTYVYVFGDQVPHLHFNLAPHTAGDALVGGPGLLAAGAVDAQLSEHEQVAQIARQRLAGFRLAG